MPVCMKTIIKIDAVGFDDLLLNIYFPTSLQELTEHTCLQPTGEYQRERVIVLLL